MRETAARVTVACVCGAALLWGYVAWQQGCMPTDWQRVVMVGLIAGAWSGFMVCGPLGSDV